MPTDPSAILFLNDAPGGAAARHTASRQAAAPASDPAHTLFPDDAPAAPPSHARRRQAAEGLLGLAGKFAARTQRPEDTAAADKDHAAGTVFPNEVTPAAPPVDPDADPADKMFPDDAAAEYDASAVTDLLDGLAGSAEADGDAERAGDLRAASEALAADFAAAGTPPEAAREIMDLMKDAQSGLMAGPVPPERLAAEQKAGLAVLAAGGVTDADLGAARALIADVERIAPGTMASLEATGAGNDVRLVRKVIAEARRRGYR